MRREDYRVFSEGHIGGMKLKNRLVRSATGDVIITRKVTDRVIMIYTKLAKAGVWLIITRELLIGESPELRDGRSHNSTLWFEGVKRIAKVVHEYGDDYRIMAQIGAEGMGLVGSDYPGRSDDKSVVDIDEFPEIIDSFIWLTS